MSGMVPQSKHKRSPTPPRKDMNALSTSFVDMSSCMRPSLRARAIKFPVINNLNEALYFLQSQLDFNEILSQLELSCLPKRLAPNI